MASIVEHRMDSPNLPLKRRKIESHHPESSASVENMDAELGWHLLQPILENEVLCAKIPRGMAFDLLARWFQIIVGDKEKLRLFRQWVLPSSEFVDECTAAKASSLESKRDIDEPEDDRPSSSIAKATSIDFINNDTPITPRTTPQVLLLQKLLQQQQQQIVLLQKLQKSSTTPVSPIPTISITPTTGTVGSPIAVTIKDGVRGQWHEFSDKCTCTCGFTTIDGTVVNAQRLPGGNEPEMRFSVPAISFPSPNLTNISLVVHLTSCAATHTPLVCTDSFTYTRETAALPTSSDEDSDTPDSSMCDDEDNDEDSGDRSVSNLNAPSLSPKQLMTIRERMMEYIHSPSKGPARVMVAQQPTSKVVWKNRRLDNPFKVRVEGAPDSSKLSALAIVVDHKGKLQIDAMENFEEECSAQGIAIFHNMRMTKGTWGKEWTITFVVVAKASMGTNNPQVVGVSQACPVVVKTRKNPQVRHVGSSSRSESPSPIFVERPDASVRKRNRVEDLLDNDPSPHSRAGLHSEDMTSLLYAAEIKQQERESFQVVRRPAPPPPPQQHIPVLSSSASDSSPSPPLRNVVLPSIVNGFGGQEPNFANLQSLLGFLEDVKLKQRPSLNIVEQPQLKRDNKILIVKKGKPFRTPFRVHMRSTMPPVRGIEDFNPQQYTCVAVVRNDKGEEVALKNSETTFDNRGTATFAGLMVMKGTWGKAVQLTFEARWSGAKRIAGNNNNSWPPLRMLVVAETPSLQLMCYTKDKKASTPA